MTRSVEIPEAVVSRAADAFRDNLEYDAFGEVGDDQRFDAMRFALVAARPYLMPTREQIAEALHHDNHRLGSPRCTQLLNGNLISCYERSMHDAATVLALLNGAESGREGSEFICSDSPDGRHNTVPALGGNDEPLGYNHCGYCGTRLDW